MRVFLDVPPKLSRAMTRVEHALKAFVPPSVEVTQDRSAADLVLLHVIGYPETVAAIEELQANGQKYSIIRYCMRTTQRPNTADWIEMWRGAMSVWSYYDLEALTHADLTSFADVNFYHSPLGGDASVFKPSDVPRSYEILTSGFVMETEGVLEAHDAVTRVDGKMVHLGPGDTRFSNRVYQTLGIADRQLAELYSRCRWVAGLRRGEGFEMPAVEGLLCGCRPIVFDAPHYRRWYEGFAEFVPEGTTAELTDSLEAIFRAGVRRVGSEERARAAEFFDWQRIIEGYWEKTLGIKKPRASTSAKPKLLWVGDAGVASGFARATHAILETVKQDWDVHVLGLNYDGDPHPYDYPIHPCVKRGSGDYLGMERLPSLTKQLQPDLIVIQNDPWNFYGYAQALRNEDPLLLQRTPLVGVVAVDGKNCRGWAMKDLTHGIFWTKFGQEEAKLGGFTKPSSIIGLGVDLGIYKPQNRRQVRTMMGLERFADSFIVGNVNRNQPRKRLDLTISYFAQWVHAFDIKDAYLYLHVSPTGDVGWDVEQLMRYYGLADRLILSAPDIGTGISEEELAATYCAFDVQLSTTSGEGFGLTTLEGMACGIPQIVPCWSALAEWPGIDVIAIGCSETMIHPGGINTIGAIPDRTKTIDALDLLYRSKAHRAEFARRGLAHASLPEYRWDAVGRRYLEVLTAVMEESHAAVA